MSAAGETLAALQGRLPAGHKIITALEAGLVQDWVRTNRLLVLAEFANEAALLVWVEGKNSAKNFSLERVIPVDTDFKCEIAADDSNSSLVSTDVFLKLSRQKLRLLFQVMPGFKVNKFVDEMVKATEAVNKRRATPDFSWIDSYQIEAKETIDGDVETSLCSAVEECELVCDEGSPGQSRRVLKAEPNLNSLDSVSVHRIPIALGEPPNSSGATPIAARESVVRYQMTLREGAFTDLRSLRVFLGTYNVNGQAPTSGLADWLAIDAEPPDVVAVGFQELDLSKEAFLFNETPREDEWQRAVMRALHPRAKYRKVRLVRLVGMMLIVFVQEKHFAYVRAVAAETVGTGLMGKLGNKGGVAVRMELYNSSLCFVNSHLAAHVEEVERRNQDYVDICNRLVFSAASHASGKSIKDHDVVFWIGDLNYRLSSELEMSRVKELLEQQNYAALLEADQFRAQYALRKIFVGYEEGVIEFRPSYKYDPGTDNWDTSEKNRAPAWCDRILWKGENVQALEYRSHPTLRMSDHKPVSALLECGVKIIDPVRYRKIYEEVMKKLDKLENEFLPQVSVDTTEIVLDSVVFNESRSRVLTVANTGQVPVQFEFIKKHREASYCKPWLKVEPCTGFLMPGDNAYVTLEVLVDKTTAWSLNSGLDTLYDILVLHLEGGKDIFITVSGQYHKSCFGCSIEALIHMHQPVGQAQAEHIAQLEKAAALAMAQSNADADSTQPVLAVPKEMWFLLDELYRRGLDVPGLFEQPGLPAEIAAIRSTLDTSLPENLPGSVHSVAGALLIFLETLREPIVPYGLTLRALDGCASFATCRAVVQSAPLSHQHFFKHAISFLKELLLHSNRNGLDAKTLVALFGSAFIRLPPPNYPLTDPAVAQALAAQPHLERRRSMFVHHFLVNELDD